MRLTILIIAFVFFIIGQFELLAQKQVPVTIESSSVVFMDELDAYFYQAAINFINFKDLEASEDINKALFFISFQAQNLNMNDELVKMAKELNKLSTGLQSGN